MSFFQIVSALQRYGADVLLLALGVAALSFLLKKTVLKNCSGKALVFLPFAIGLALYGCYRAASTLSYLPFTEGIKETAEGGFSCGCAATLYETVYMEFRGKRASPLAPLLEDIIPEETRGETAERLLAEARALPQEAREEYFLEALKEYENSDEARAALAALLARFVNTL